MLLLAGISCAGCLTIPIHHKKQMKSESLAPAPKSVDLTFVKPGETSREDVLGRLAWIESGANDDRFFLGRWSESEWDVIWAAAAFPYGGVGDHEVWKAHNVVIDFDEHALVRKVEFFSDRDTAKVLSSRVVPDANHLMDLTTPIKIPMQTDTQRRGAFLLASDRFEYAEEDDKKQKHGFTTPPENVVRLTTSRSDPAHPEFFWESLYFRDKTKMGRKMNIRVNLSGTALLMKYIAQFHPNQTTEEK